MQWKSKMVDVCNNHFIQSYIWLKSITKGVLLRQTDRQAMQAVRKENNKNVIPLCMKSKLQHLLASPAENKKNPPACTLTVNETEHFETHFSSPPNL